MMDKNTHAAYLSMAGGDYMWNLSPRTTDRYPASYPVAGVKVSGVRAGLRDMLADMQGGVCFMCGRDLCGTLNLSHVVARGPKVRGFVRGGFNVGTAHAGCNGADLGTAVLVTWNLDELARPDVIPALPEPIEVARWIIARQG